MQDGLECEGEMELRCAESENAASHSSSIGSQKSDIGFSRFHRSHSVS